MFNVFQMLKAVPDALAESSRSRARRNAQAHRLIAPPPAGTPLLVSLAFALEHTGIYLGGSKVAELHGDGRVRAVSLTQFINGDSDGTPPMRSGTRIFAACDARTRKPLASGLALETARGALESEDATVGYDYAFVNCHLFTAACARGVSPNSKRFRRLLGGGASSIGRLEALLSKALNGGDDIAWCAVRRDRESFRYRLTPEKKFRLAIEGK